MLEVREHMSRLAFAIAVAAGLATAACGAGRDPCDRDEVVAGFPDRYPSLLVTNPRTMVALEREGLGFGHMIGATGESADELARAPLYADLRAAVLAQLDEPRPGEVRRFDPGWLDSPRVHFELIGVVNRLDLRGLTPPGCGQTRMIYRLAYAPAGRPVTRLPMTISLIYERGDAPCAELATAWLALDATRDPRDLPAQLRAGPLAPLAPAHMDKVELNLQSLRANAAGATSDDHAEYLLLAFLRVNGGLVADGLRDTPAPDCAPAVIHDWIVGHLDAIDAGTAELPTALLADSAISVTPRGLSRARNRPFSALFPDPDAAFADAALAGRTIARSPAMLVRRLDEMSCAGCHQARSIAGFHLLGEDRAIGSFDTVVLGMSEHLREVLDWRHQFLIAAAHGDALPLPVPLPEHGNDRGELGAHCRPPDGRADLPAWGCAPGLACRRSTVDGDPVGQCVRDQPPEIGDPCQAVRLVTRSGADGDEVHAHRPHACIGWSLVPRTCSLNHRGFPGGMCTESCVTEGEHDDDSVCARIPHFGFERACFAPGVAIEDCLRDPAHTVLERLRMCSRTEPCRDDFVCANVAGLARDRGACVPPYFLFQTRVDGPHDDR